MTQKPHPQQTKAEQVEIEQMQAIYAWVEAQMPAAPKCDYCGNQPQFESKNKDGWLVDHLRKTHARQCIQDHALKRLHSAAVENPDDVHVFEELGIDVTEDNTRIDLLRIDPKIKQQEAAAGSKLYFATGDQVDHYKAMGMEVVTSGETTRDDSSSADGAVRAREMVLMRIPPALRDKLDRIKRDKIDNSLRARQEQGEVRVNALIDRATSILRRKGLSDNAAQNVAQALTNRLEREQVR